MRFGRLFARHAVRTTLTCTALLLSLASSAEAAPAWLSPTILAETQTEGRPDVAVDAAGDVTAAWVRSGGSSDFEIQAATRPAGGAWEAPARLNLLGEQAGAPRVASGPQGAAVVVWESGGPEHFVVEVASKSSANAAWTPPTQLDTTGPANPEPQVAIDSAGNAVAVWGGQPVPGLGRIMASTMPAGGAWSSPVGISRGNTGDRARLAVDAHGDFTAIWEGFDVIESAVKPAGGNWEMPAVLTELWAGSPAVSVNAGGEAIAAWILNLSNTERRIEGAARSPDGSWGTPVALSEVTEQIGRPDVAIDARGDAAASWSTSSGESISAGVFAAVRPSGGSWQTPTELSRTDPPESNPQIAIAPSGEVLAVWWGVDEGDTIVESSARPTPSAGWQAPVALSRTASYMAMPRLAEDGQGNAVAAWTAEESGGAGAIRVAGYDAAGPHLRDSSIPSSGLVGQPVTLSVSPLDVWSELGATSWSFGDGTGATGTTATHAYAKAGIYEVRIASADVLGNTTSAAGLIAISEQPGRPTARSAPVLSGVRQSHRRWRERGSAPSRRARRLPIGTRFTFGLNAPARVTFSFTHGGEGRQVGRKCLALRAINRRRPHCKRVVVAGAISFAGRAGVNTVPFAGRLTRSRRLRPERYTLVIKASNADGISRPRRLAFVIVG